MGAERTEADAWVLFTDVLTLLVGEEHVSGKAALGRIRICADSLSAGFRGARALTRRLHTFLLLLGPIGGLCLGLAGGLLFGHTCGSNQDHRSRKGINENGDQQEGSMLTRDKE